MKVGYVFFLSSVPVTFFLAPRPLVVVHRSPTHPALVALAVRALVGQHNYLLQDTTATRRADRLTF